MLQPLPSKLAKSDYVRHKKDFVWKMCRLKKFKNASMRRKIHKNKTGINDETEIARRCILWMYSAFFSKIILYDIKKLYLLVL